MNIRDIMVVFKINSVFVYILLISLINRIFMYSAIKIRANGELLYSMLKPNTSSDSPSAKSNGVRCVSSNIEINQAMISGIVKTVTHIYWSRDRFIIFIDNEYIIKQIIIRDILTSYEIVWAIPRRAPSSLHLELDLQPAIKVVYTFMLVTHRKYIMLNFIRNNDFECGNNATQFFRVTGIFHIRNFDITPVPVRSVDAESLSKIAIHNFKKSRKIEIRVVPNGRRPGVYLDQRKRSWTYRLLYTQCNTACGCMYHFQPTGGLTHMDGQLKHHRSPCRKSLPYRDA